VVCRCVWSRNHKIPREWGGQGPLGGYGAKRERERERTNHNATLLSSTLLLLLLLLLLLAELRLPRFGACIDMG